jgi:hypothetical protein
MEKVAITHRRKDKKRITNLQTTISGHMKIIVMER